MDQFRTKAPQQKVVQQARPAAPAPEVKKEKRSVKKIALIMAVAVVVLAAGLAAWKLTYKSKGLTGVDKNRYQALFLTNGQVYFGKLTKADGKTIKIDDIFYLQVQQAVQPKAENETQQGETQLVKLGGELHGPEDTMFIDRGQILFWENLKDDGKVVQAINQYKKQ